MKSFLLTGLFCALCLSPRSAHSSWEQVPDQQALRPILKGPEQRLPEQLKLLTWNIQKAQEGDSWRKDFLHLTSDVHLALLQEGVESPFVMQVLRSFQLFSWWIARSFFIQMPDQATGVVTGAAQEPFSQVFLRSPGHEPFSKTAKMSLLTTYNLQNGSRLLVVNSHALNFTGLEPFQNQVEQISGLVKGWTDKVIVGGDFNTWNSGRMKVLKQVMTESGLSEVTFREDPRLLVLDHLFVRGCRPLQARVHSEVDSSDHYPLTAEVLCAP